ncbi:oligosaccharide flippase family protein [Candidatus Woesearchaeota archaeon]|jgi:O-antigen/teichoic acid export membrane protein|nr:oligosaccharide flippase family protein [Candidatus Woesearchaeota archaeon]
MINRELSVLIVGRVLQIIIALMAIKIATKFLQADELGNFYLLVSITGFFSLFMVNPIGQYINRRTHDWHKQKKLLNVFYLYNYYLIFLTLFSIIIVYLLHYYNIGDNINFSLFLIIVPIYIYFHSWNQTIIPMINILEGRVAFVLFTIASQLLFLIISYLLITLLDEKGALWFLGQAIAFGIVGLISLVYFIKKFHIGFDVKAAHRYVNNKNVRNMLNFSAPLSISVLFFWLQSQSYGIIIEKNIGSEFLGYFGVGMAIAFAISSAFEAIVMQYLYPKMYQSMSDNNKFSRMISNISNLILPIYFYLAIFVTIFAINIVTILVDEKYYSSYIFVIFGIWVAFFRMSSNIISNIAHSKMKTKKLILPNIVGAIIAVTGVTIATNFENYDFFIPLSLLLASMISFFVNFRIMSNILHINLKVKNFLMISLFSLPLLISLFFSEYLNDVLFSTFIVGMFGLYFCYSLYNFFIINQKESSM